MQTVGEQLRGERVRRGLSIDELAARTRIASRYLEAIEAGDIRALPGEFFYRSFVRQYAAALGLDESDFDHEVRPGRPPDATLTPATRGAQRIYEPEVHEVRDSRFGEALSRMPMSVLLLVVVVVGTSAVYTLWYRETAPSSLPAEPPGQSAAAAPAAPTPTAETAPAAGVPPESKSVQPSVGQESPAAPVPVDAKLVTLELTASEAAWVSVSSGGKNLYTGTLGSGESRVLQAGADARLTVGNAGGLQVKLNGRDIGPLGPRGQTRVYSFTAEGAQAVVRKPPADDEESPGGAWRFGVR
jgi:cytoskeletal protein RodZ